MRSQLLVISMLFMTLVLAFVISESEVAYCILLGPFSENIWIDFFCVNGTLDVECLIHSIYPELVHFPSEVDMSDSRLQKCISMVATFNGTTSNLTYTFNETSSVEARTYADAITQSMNLAVGLTFDWQHTSSDSLVVVSYAAPGVSDMASFTDSLRSKCLKSDIGGFSNVLVDMVTKSPQSTVYLEARGPGFEWGYSFKVAYTTKVQPGEDSHTIDVLNLIGVSELAPSPYCLDPYLGYISSISVDVYSPWNATFISCEPPEASYDERGWWISPFETYLRASFDFYDDPTPVNTLFISFSGKVIPEFNSSMMLLLFLSATALIPIFRRRLSKNRGN